MSYKRMLVGVFLLLAASPAVAADYALGLVAFNRGDIDTAHREFSALAEEGDPAAQYSLAMLYLKRDPPEYTSAIPWLRKSAGSGLPESQFMLGMLTLHGVGTEIDASEGLRWIERASGQGNADAQALLVKLEQARLREAESARRKAEQAKKLQADFAKARAAEQALKKRLAKSREREKRLAAERATLKKARASDARAKEQMRLERARLEEELESLRARLAEAERARVALQASERVIVDQTAIRTETTGKKMPHASVVAGTVVEVLPDGVLLTDVSRRLAGHSEPFPDGLVVFLNLASTDGLSEGQQVAYPAEPATSYRYKLESGATGRVRAFRAVDK